ncbi:Ectonucleoside triphosphate diphosphohydrolase 8 [Nymphon striatum]|nr:Ectonucleoside triphosphate diphosphohydrolase 8 [Nymphon striatum]
MNVIIQSTLSGRAAGFQTVTAAGTDNVDKLISAYCIAKGIPQRPYYILRTAKNIPLDSVRTIESYKIEDGETLFMGSKADEDSMFGFNNWWIVAFMALVIGGIGIVAVTLVYFLDVPEDPTNYSIVFDAGSTHSMAFLYKWKTEKVDGTGVVQQSKSCKSKGKGISSFVDDPNKAGLSLNTCIQDLKDDISKDDIATSPIYLGATAGMRLLNLKNKAAALEILDSTRETFHQSGLLFKSSEIIPGSAEGEFGWITVNYLDKNFEITKSRESHHTVGALDLGGASTQITYETEGSYNINVTLFGKTHDLYTHSFLCFGMTQIHFRYLASLMEDLSGNTTTFEDPCAPVGHQNNITSSKLFDTICSISKDIHTNMEHLKGKNFTFVGKSNPKQCKTKIDALFNFDKCNKTYQEELCFSAIPEFQHSKFLAISGFYSAVSFLNITNVTLAKFDSQITSFCNKTWNEVCMAHDLIFVYCFDGLYINHLLVSGYGFNSTYWSKIVFTDKDDPRLHTFVSSTGHPYFGLVYF